MQSHTSIQSRVLALSVAALGALSANAVHANVLAMAPSLATLTLAPGLAEPMTALVLNADGSSPFQITFTGDAAFAAGVLSAPVDSVSVTGVGPGPVHINLQRDAGVSVWNNDIGGMSASNFQFDVGSKAFTVDLTYQAPWRCPEGMMCAAVMPAPMIFKDVALFTSGEITGSIDGGMPLDNAIAVPTFAPQKIDLTTDLYFNLQGLVPVAAQLGLTLDPTAMAEPIKFATLSISAVPEASTFSLMGLGLMGLGLLAQRRRRLE